MVTEARRTVRQIEASITTYALRYKDKHPKMIAAKASLADAKDKLREAVLAQPAILRNAIEQGKATEASLNRALQDQQGVAVALNRTAIGWQELARQAETDRALYESVLRQIKETSLSKDVKANAVSVIEHSPLFPQSPVSPRPTRTIFLGLLGGLAVGLAFIFGADALDRSIKTVDQAENTVGLPVFAAVPETTDEGPVNRLKRRSKKAFGSSNYRVVVETPESPAAEAFRNLRAALSLLGRKWSVRFRFSPAHCLTKGRASPAPTIRLLWRSRVTVCFSLTAICAGQPCTRFSVSQSPRIILTKTAMPGVIDCLPEVKPT